MIHKVKCCEPFFTDAARGIKGFELRKNDRGYLVGDGLILEQYIDGKLTGLSIDKKITYMLEGYTGIEAGYCILGIE